ncbi:MAG: amidohydrolase [Erysipelotrichaceae bacterium]|nr:amidohydrolase [Erysipelotrichaceae bacterium]
MKTTFINGKIYTMNPNREIFSNMVVENGIITKLSNTNETNENVVDLRGNFIYPGFNDSHLHLLNYGYVKFQVNLFGISSKNELISKLRQYLIDYPLNENQWLLARGWNNDYFSDDPTFLTKYDLDKISTTIPIFLTRACGHVASVNSKALEIANINIIQNQPHDGFIDVNNQNESIGIFRENALNIIKEYVSRPSIKQMKQMILTAIKEMNKYGITSVHSDDFGSVPGYKFEEVLQIFEELAKNDELNIRIYEQCRLNYTDFIKFLELGYANKNFSDFFRIGPLKLFLDGALGARTAALNEPYNDKEDYCGITTLSDIELDNFINLAYKNNMGIVIHAIGDKAIETGIKAFSKNKRDDLRNGIIHCQITNIPILNSFKDNNILAYVQPIFLDYDWHIVKERVGDRANTSYNWKTLIDLGVHVSFGTDCPVEHFNPFHNMYEAITRKDLKGQPEEGYLIDQALNIDQSLFAYTYESAYSEHLENIKGTLEVGKYADFIVLEEDLYCVDKNHIKDMSVLSTYVNGVEVYKK